MPLVTTLRGMFDAGIRAVEIGTPPRHFAPMRREQLLEVSHRLRDYRIAPVAIHAPFGGLLDLTDPNPHHRNAAIGAILSAASVLRELGGSRVVVHVSDVARNVEDLDQRIAHATESLRVLARACAHMDTLLLVETPLPQLVGGHPDEFAALLKPLDRSVGACFDTSHATLGHHWDDFMRVAGERLVHLHANDHHGRADDHLTPGDGVVDWRHIRETLVAVGFDGWVVLELACPVGPLSEYMSGAMRRAQTLFETPVGATALHHVPR
jgi:sugar phosphate isomerase/epimerase